MFRKTTSEWRAAIYMLINGAAQDIGKTQERSYAQASGGHLVIDSISARGYTRHTGSHVAGPLTCGPTLALSPFPMVL